MAKNPLQQYFRQPKIFISLPSQGVYSKPGSIDGDPTKLPLFGMTGMDEIMLKTADGLLSGDSTASVINSCCPAIVDPWELSTLDIDLILAAIRIATYGEELAMIKTCSECNTENEYAIKLSKFIDHFSSCEYHNVVEVEDLKVTIRPLTYRQSQDFSFKNFMLQQKIFQLSEIKNEVFRPARKHGYPSSDIQRLLEELDNASEGKATELIGLLEERFYQIINNYGLSNDC
jgi:hypothetical protein